MAAEGFDTIVVGAGSAGCVLASRWSEDPGRAVLLLEAGPDHRLADLPPELRYLSRPADWPYDRGDGVVDADGRVLGVDGLRVCDASIVPTVPRSNTNRLVMAVAERLVERERS